jgi:hypothetical protein
MSEERDYEQEAQTDGWRPQEEWQGDPEKWVDAKTFVERGEKISGILKSKLDRVEQRLAKAEQANQKFGEYHKKTIEKERQAAEARVHQLESMLAKAIDEGDGQTFTKLNREINDLKTNIPDAPNMEPQMDALTEEWLANNRWYVEDQQLGIFADGAADRVRAQGFSGKAYYDELTRLTKEAFPEKFGNPNRQKENAVDSGEPASTGKTRTYKNLPKEAKEMCDEFVAQGFMTKEDYVAQYEFDDEVA